MSVLFSQLITVKADEVDFSIVNNINLTDWQTSIGNNPNINIKEDKIVGINLTGSGQGKIFEYTYLKEVNYTNMMLDFYVDLNGLDYSCNPKLIFVFESSNISFSRFEILLTSTGYDCKYIAGENVYIYSGMSYKSNDDGHIQLRIAKDNVTDYSSGNVVNTWNMVVGVQNKVTQIKDDKYSKRKNEIDDSSFSGVCEYLDNISNLDNTKVIIEGYCDSNDDLSMVISQITTECFYDYYVISSKYIELTKQDYTNLSFKYSIPEGLNIKSYSGFLIERYNDDKIEKTYINTSKYSTSFADSNLVQNTNYSYNIVAYESISTSNRVACNKVTFKYELTSFKTLKGNPTKLIITILIIIISMVAFVLIYTYFYDIIKALKKK